MELSVRRKQNSGKQPIIISGFGCVALCLVAATVTAGEKLRLLSDKEIADLLPKVSLTQSSDYGEYFGPDGRYMKWGYVGQPGSYRVSDHRVCIHLDSQKTETCKSVFVGTKGRYYTQVVGAHAGKPEPWYGKF